MKTINRSFQPEVKRFGTWMLLFFFVFLLVGCIRQGVYHKVKPGQTLYRISKTYDVDEAYLARINGIPNPTQLRVGTRVFIPGATTTKYVPATVPGYATTGNKTPKTTRAKSSVKKKPSVSSPSTPKNKVSVKSSKTRYKKSAKANISLQWPLRGKILRDFGESGKGGGKGVEIAARKGSMVRAAAAGKVIYSGDGVQGFGHLMILQHENDVFTVYGFNSRNHVKQGQFVSQGEKIASSGLPPSGGSGRLHFEVRVGKLAVNPILYLP